MITLGDIIRYIVEGLAVAIAFYLISRRQSTAWEVLIIGLTAGLTFLILDLFTSGIGTGTRQGMGFSLGFQQFGAGQSKQTPSKFRSWGCGESNVPEKWTSRWMGWNEEAKPVNTQTNEYQLVPGRYAKYIIRPGYSEHVMPMNEDQLYVFYPFDELKPSTTTAVKKMRGGYQNETRLGDVVYSGDIIDIMMGDTIMQRGTANSQIIFDQPIPTVKTNLSKVRFVLAVDRDPNKQIPLKYGDVVYLQHNAVIDNQNMLLYIKYGERLQSHQEGPLFNSYRIYSKNNPNRRDFVKYGEPIIIATEANNQGGDRNYLKVEADKSVSNNAIPSDASGFTLTLRQPYELNDRNLCICPQDTIYP